MNSILLSIKKLLGISEEYNQFDEDIIIAINTAIMVLTQLGVGPKNGFTVTDDTDTWTDFLGCDSRLECAKTYVHLKTRLIFDTPSNSGVKESIEKTLSELEWRMTLITEGSN